ncbi:MAG: hypothetical protein ACE141_11780 [Bryobacteraceae bacterium]
MPAGGGNGFPALGLHPMNSAKPNPAARFLPSLTDVVFLMPVVLLFLRMEGAKRMLGDGDTGWHIRAGEWILQHGGVPRTDMFSFTKAGEPWYAWEWLWDVAFAWLHRQAGMAAVVLASILVLSFTFALLYRLVLRECPNVLIAFAVTFAATAGSTMHWLARPHLFTLLFVAVFYALLERARQGRTRLLLLLPPLMVIWTNIHGGFFVGIILIGCYVAGELVQWLLEPDPEKARGALLRSRPFLLTGLVSAAVTLVNPYSYGLHVHMWKFLTGSFHLRYINEYQPTQFQNGLALWYEPLVLLGVAAVAWSVYHRRFAHAIMAAGWLHLALFSVRNLPIYLIVAAPCVAGMLYDLLKRVSVAPLASWVGKSLRAFDRFAEEFGANDRIPRLHLASAAGFVAMASLFYAPAPPANFRAEYDVKQYPAAALEVLRGPETARSIFADDEWGDYLIYRLYPQTKVFVDGRFDLYGEEFTKKYLDVLNAKYGWEDTLKKYSVDTILLRVDTPLAGALKESRRWHPIFDDGMAIVFRSQAALAVRAQPEENQNPAGLPGRNVRDRVITRVNPSGPRTTDSKTRSESL